MGRFLKKFLTVLCLCVVSNIAFGGPTYNCVLQSNSGSAAATLKFPSGNLVCGHKGTDGCNDGIFISVRNGIPDGKSADIPVYRCDSSGTNTWFGQPVSSIKDCETLELPELLGEFDGNNVYYKLGDGEALSGACKINLADAERNCIDTDGKWADNKCECSGTVEKDGGLDVSPCKCVADLERGTDLDGNNPNKCWPKPYLRKKCLKFRDSSNDWFCPNYSGSRGDHLETNPNYSFYIFEDKQCYCDDLVNNSRICVNGDHAEYRANCNCPGFSFDAVKAAYESDTNEWDVDKDGFDCMKPKSQYNYQTCSNDNDCKNIDNTKRPYLHSTAWHCAWQSAGVRVCTATACESGWTPINGYCQEDKNTQTPQSENKNANLVSNIKTETKAGTKKPCTDPDNMDSNCKCIVAGTVERGEKCVCRDDNQEIKNGKCEWTAKYVAGLESDLDSKFNGLSATIGGFEKNVWRDENGEFNTARLASDSIAGVVLGTVGGIVTANLVKKAQVKQGFEDIGCYIGGQSVAGYGDEFNVGR